VDCKGKKSIPSAIRCYRCKDALELSLENSDTLRGRQYCVLICTHIAWRMMHRLRQVAAASLGVMFATCILSLSAPNHKAALIRGVDRHAHSPRLIPRVHRLRHRCVEYVAFLYRLIRSSLRRLPLHKKVFPPANLTSTTWRPRGPHHLNRKS